MCAADSFDVKTEYNSELTCVGDPEGSRFALWPDRYKRYNSARVKAAADKYVKIAGEAGCTPAQLALAFCKCACHLFSGKNHKMIVFMLHNCALHPQFLGRLTCCEGTLMTKTSGQHLKRLGWVILRATAEHIVG